MITKNTFEMQTEDVITKTKWTIDPANSQIGFAVKYLLFTIVRGSFKKFETNIFTEGNDFKTAKIDLLIHAASIDTGNETRDAHLKSADFFDIEHFGEIKFTSNALVNVDNGKPHELIGDLTIKGVTKIIKLDVEPGGLVKD